MVALPLFDLVLCSDDDANRAARVAEQLIESTLSELGQIEKIDESLAPVECRQFDRQAIALLRGMYERWATDAEALLDRVGRLETRFGRIIPAEALRDAHGRTRAMLSVSLDDLEVGHKDAAGGRTVPAEEVRRELRARTH